MTNRDVTSDIEVCEINDEEVEFGINDKGDYVGRPEIRVHSRWNDDDRVILEVEAKKYNVVADDLTNTIQNATNW